MPYKKVRCPTCDGLMAWNSKQCSDCRLTRGASLDMTGRRFGILTVVGPSNKHQIGSGEPSWVCRCDCGRTTDVRGCDLRNRGRRSCGCLNARNRLTHGVSRTPEYKVWMNMHERCENPDDPAWHNYGGRGIQVCARWADVSTFIADMGRRPEGSTLERIDNNGPYSPENCRWATRREQSVNTRRTVMLTYAGETLPMKDWAAKAGIRYGTLHFRIKSGWPVERALTTPIGITFGPRKS